MTAKMNSASEEGSAEGSRWIYQSIVAINNRMVWSVLVLQPITGAWLIFESGRNQCSFSQEWLWIAILIYAALFAIALFGDKPRQDRLLRMIESGDSSSDEYLSTRKRQDQVGGFMGLMVVVITFLMVLKPGA